MGTVSVRDGFGGWTPKSAITDWQKRLKKVYVMAGIPDRHSHRLRDTFSVDLLQKGVPIETVSMLLGHKDTRFFYSRSECRIVGV
jgi:integrase